MANFFQYSTESLLLQWTEEFSDPDNLLPISNKKNEVEHFLYYPVDPLYEVITGSIIFCVGLVLNALILRCYWSVKTSTAVYIRFLAVYDITVLHCSVAAKTASVIFLADISSDIELVRRLTASVLLSYAMLGLLFMALDRILVIVFPHTFKKHEKKIRIAKILIVSVQTFTSLLWWAVAVSFGIKSAFTHIFFALSVIIFFMQFFACVSLYVAIVWKVRAASRKVRPLHPIAIPYVHIFQMHDSGTLRIMFDSLQVEIYTPLHEVGQDWFSLVRRRHILIHPFNIRSHFWSNRQRLRSVFTLHQQPGQLLHLLVRRRRVPSKVDSDFYKEMKHRSIRIWI